MSTLTIEQARNTAECGIYVVADFDSITGWKKLFDMQDPDHMFVPGLTVSYKNTGLWTPDWYSEQVGLPSEPGRHSIDEQEVLRKNDPAEFFSLILLAVSQQGIDNLQKAWSQLRFVDKLPFMTTDFDFDGSGIVAIEGGVFSKLRYIQKGRPVGWAQELMKHYDWLLEKFESVFVMGKSYDEDVPSILSSEVFCSPGDEPLLNLALSQSEILFDWTYEIDNSQASVGSELIMDLYKEYQNA